MDAVTVGADVCQGLLEDVEAAGTRDHARALIEERDDGGESDAGAAARDEDCAFGELEIHGTFLGRDQLRTNPPLTTSCWPVM
jgi:hypothetical protein